MESLGGSIESGEDTQNFLEPSILHMHPVHTFYLPSMGRGGWEVSREAAVQTVPQVGRRLEGRWGEQVEGLVGVPLRPLEGSGRPVERDGSVQGAWGHQQGGG